MVCDDAGMDLDKLRTLVELSRRGTMAAVAEATGYGTSAVSQQLAALERQVKVPLLEASGRRVRLTPAGRRLVAHAERILADVTAAELDLSAAAEPSGVVRVAGLHDRAAAAPAAGAWTSSRERYPLLELEIQEGEPDEVDALLDDDEIDLGLEYDYTLVPRGGRGVCTLLFSGEMVLAVHPDLDPGQPIRTPGGPGGLPRRRLDRQLPRLRRRRARRAGLRARRLGAPDAASGRQPRCGRRPGAGHARGLPHCGRGTGGAPAADRAVGVRQRPAADVERRTRWGAGLARDQCRDRRRTTSCRAR